MSRREGQRSLCEAACFELQIMKGRLVRYLLVKWLYYNRLYVLPVTCYEQERSQNC